MLLNAVKHFFIRREICYGKITNKEEEKQIFIEHFGEKFGGIGLSFTALLILFFIKDNRKRFCNVDKESSFTRDGNFIFAALSILGKIKIY